jgi:peptide/nickel transport system substrate-binding protein
VIFKLSAVLLLAMTLGATTNAAETPKRGGILTYAVQGEPPNYDCHANTSYVAIHLLRPFYSTLLKFDVAHFPAIVGDLAESWSVSPDNLTYSFRLHAGATFHDGSTLTSADVKASYQRLMDPPTGVVSARKANFEDIAAIETPDPLTVVFKLKAINAAMLSNFASPWDCIYSAAKLAQDPKFPEKTILGSGPFRFVEHVAGSHFTGARFDNYYDKGKPYLDGFRAVIMTGATVINSIQSGQVLAEFRGQSPPERNRLVAALGDKITVQTAPWTCLQIVVFNTEKKPFDDPRVRRALTLAIDRWAGAAALTKTTILGPVGGLLRPGYEFAVKPEDLEKLPGFSRDIAASRAEARRLLKEAGQDKLKFTFNNRTIPMPYAPLGIFLVDQWRQIGVTVDQRMLETQAWLGGFASGNYEAGLDFTCDYTDDPNVMWLKYLSADRSPVNYERYQDRTLDDLYERQKRATDPAARYQLLREFESRVLTESYAVPTIWWQRIVAHWSTLKGWPITPNHYNQDLSEVWLDQ